jgi:Uma2 family endonuclease
MSGAAPRLCTYEDILHLPEHVRAEVLGGVVEVSPAPLPKHSKAQGSLRRFVGGPFDDDDGFGGVGGWWIFVEVDVQLGPHDVVRPDLAGWRRPRLPDPGDQRPITVVPDWICEIVSPTSVRRDRVKKRDLYGQHQVPHYWIVDVEARTLEAFERQEDRWVLVGNYEDDDTASIPPFEAIELPVGRLFLPETKKPDEG